MSDSIFDDHSEEGDAIVQKVLQQASALPEAEAKFIHAISEICLDLHSLIVIALNAGKEKVTEWQEALRDVPNAIGLYQEFSHQAQERIAMILGIITLRIDEELPTLGRMPEADDSGINLREDSGIYVG